MRSPMVMEPERPVGELFAATVKESAPDPVSLAPELRVIQGESVVALRGQLAGEVILIAPPKPPEGALRLDGLNPIEQPRPVWLMEKGIPAIFRRAKRTVPLVPGATA